MKTTISIIILQLFALTLISQTKKYKDITISGHFSEKAQSEIFRDTEFWFCDEVPLHDFLITSNHKFTINDGDFTTKIETETPYGFFRCRATQIPSLRIDYFFVSAGDSVFMEINDQRDVLFKGRGSEKLNYQHFAAKTIAKYQFIQPEDSVKYNVGKYELRFTKYQESIDICLDSLEKLKTSTDDKIIEILRVNTISSVLRNYVTTITGSYPFANAQDKSIILNQLRVMLAEQQMSSINDPTILKYALNYIDLLYSTQVYYRKLMLVGNTTSKINPSDLYPNFKNDYTGTIRDKFIATLLLTNELYPEALELAERSLDFINDKTSNDELRKFVNTRTKGVPAFDFTFETVEGKKIKLEDFKGRLLIIDTWYKGCSNCAVLAKLVSPLVEKYSKGNRVVFLSVNVDYKKDTFIEGVKSGLYGHKNVLHSWTQGNGQNDPFIKHYQYFGYPNLLIIDKNGNVITTNAYKNENEVVANIENYIKTYQ